MKLLHRFVGMGLLACASTCGATSTLMDTIEFEGMVGIVSATGGPWLKLLENQKTREIGRQEICSAWGAPRGHWRIAEGKLWLVGLLKCSGTIKLENVYGGDGSPIFADWISADLATGQGKALCTPRFTPPGVQELGILFKVERGVVREVSRKSNQHHPAIPTLEGLRKLLGPSYGHQAEELISDWPCFEQIEIEYLQSNESIDGSNWMSFHDYVESLLTRQIRLGTH